MNGFTKKSLAVCCVIALLATLGLTYGIGTLTVDLGNITVHMPAHVIIQSAFISDVNGSVSSDGQTVSFSGLPDMIVGDKKALTLTLLNDGGTDANITSITIAGVTNVLTFNLTSGTVPCSLVAGASGLYTWSIAAVGAGSVHPVVSIAWV